MRVKSVLFFTVPAVLVLSQCSEVSTPASSSTMTSPAAGDARLASTLAPLTLRKGLDNVVVEDGGKTFSICRTELPNIEQYRFVDNKKGVVVKSRGSHGPAIVELFDTMTGTRRARVMAYEISNGQPSWAKGMQD